MAMTGKNAVMTAARAALTLGLALGASHALAQVAAIQSQDINQPGFTADLIEAKRSDGVLSVKVRLKNTGTKAAGVQIQGSDYFDQFYVQAEGKKYFVLRDTEKGASRPPKARLRSACTAGRPWSELHLVGEVPRASRQHQEVQLLLAA